MIDTGGTTRRFVLASLLSGIVDAGLFLLLINSGAELTLSHITSLFIATMGITCSFQNGYFTRISELASGIIHWVVS